MAKILIIDDDAHLLKMLGLMLERSGHELILASHGREGIDLALKSPPDMAIIDVMMPEMSGHEVCKQLRMHPGTVDIPILILTARSQAVDREVALQSGANDFMSKPVAPKELAAKVEELLEASEETENGRVIALLSLRGGVGVTTITVNLAGALRALKVPNITLVDLSPNSGHVALQMRTQPKRNWTQLLEQEDLTPDAIRSLLIGHPSGLNLLAAPVTPTPNVSLTVKQITVVAETLCERAKFIIIDAPPILNPMCVGALKAADLILLIMSPDIASIQSVSGTLRTLTELGVSAKKMHLLLNQPSSQAGLPKRTVERALKRPISFSIPFDPAQTRALAQGTPVTLDDAESPLADAMMKIAAALKKAA